MKILIFSDSHGKITNILKAFSLHPDAKLLIHLGDGRSDIEQIADRIPPYVSVNGNFEDSFWSLNKSGTAAQCIEQNGVRIFMCHGHKHSVNYSLERLIYSSMEADADIALYGHTHVKYNKYISQDHLPFGMEKGLYVFNPGSISRPRDGIYPSYGILEIQNGGILLSHGIIK